MTDTITVITLTRKRPNLLKRAIASVHSQDYPGQVTHLIIIDDCFETAQTMTKIDDGSFNKRLISHFETREPGEHSGPARCAYLRNLAVQMASTHWVAFLDDDNEYEPNHLSSLMACAFETKHSAVYSYRKIYQFDGTPYLERRFPWVRDPEEGKKVYEFLCTKGVLTHDSNILRGMVDPKGYSNPTRIVDTSEWLLARSLLIQYPFPPFTEEELMTTMCEDDKLLELLVEQEVPISTTKLATLRYYLGGYSNNRSADET